MKTKRRGRKKMWATRKQSGGDNSFTVMTFNVESWNNQIKPEDDKNQFKTFMSKESNAEASSVPDDTPENWKNIKNVILTADIICVQEDAIIKSAVGDGFTNFLENIGDRNVLSSCQSHNFYWPNNKKLYGKGSKLANSIYSKYPLTKQEMVEEVETEKEVEADSIIESQLKDDFTINTKDTFERCWAISNITIKGSQITIASIHLSGGRQDDILSLFENNFIIKIRQIKELIKQHPDIDIFCLDSNTKLRKDFDNMMSNSQTIVDVKTGEGKNVSEEKYLMELTISIKDICEGVLNNKHIFDNPLYLGLDEMKESTSSVTPPDNTITISRIYELISTKIEEKKLTEEEQNDWNKITIKQKWYIWMYGLDNFIKTYLGFRSIYDDTSKPTDIKDTTIYGGTVDGIYYKPNILKASKIEFVEGVIDSSKEDPKERKILSDHRPVKATFTRVNVKPEK